jgi:hypothetical protein
MLYECSFKALLAPNRFALRFANEAGFAKILYLIRPLAHIIIYRSYGPRVYSAHHVLGRLWLHKKSRIFYTNGPMVFKIADQHLEWGRPFMKKVVII